MTENKEAMSINHQVLAMYQASVAMNTQIGHENQALRAELSSLREQNAQMRHIVRLAEWADHSHCLSCSQFIDEGHLPKCIVAAALSGSKEEKKGDA